MEYRVVFERVDNALSRDLEGAAEKLSEQVNKLIADGWKLQGGVSTGAAGTAPYLFQALVKG